jgi:hypothetical protein
MSSDAPVVFSLDANDVFGVLAASENINAAIKGLLKRQQTPDPVGVRFMKDLKAAFSSPRSEAAKTLIAQGLPRAAPYLIALGAHAYADVVERVSAPIIEEFADDFNATYQANSGSNAVTVSDEKEFSRIMREAIGRIENALSQIQSPSGTNPSAFMRAVMISAIFEPGVIDAGYDRGLF